MNRLGPYVITGEIGRGGMGVVYHGRDPESGAEAAIKAVQPGETVTAEQVARFQREARIAAALDHPGIVRFIDTGETDGTAWFAMEYVAGRPFAQIVQEDEWEWRRIAEALRAVADALAHAHAHHVLHRDVKPSNILVDETDPEPRREPAAPRVKLADFGLAKDVSTHSKYTQTGQALGTPSYMSPEQARGEVTTLTPATDVWSVGCVFYELLTGRQAFEGDTFAAVIGHVVTGQPRPLRAARPDLPAPVIDLVEACLAKRPSDRPADGAALRDDLDRVLRGERPRHRPPRRSRPGLWVGVAALGVAVAASLPFIVGDPAPPPRVVESEAATLAARGWALRGDDPAGGAALLERAVTLEPDRLEVRLRLGMLRWATGNAADARAAWEGVPREAPEWPRAQLLLGLELLFRRDDRPEWTAAAARHAADAATAPGRTGRLARALAAFTRDEIYEVRRQLDGLQGWEAAALRALVTPSRTPAAKVREYDAALQGGIAFAWMLNNRAIAKKNQGDLAAALEDFNAALAVDPTYVFAFVSRAGAHAVAGDRAAATADLDAALTLDPRAALALGLRAEFAFADGDFETAVQDYTRALESDPAYLAARHNRASALMQLGRLDEALADVGQVLQADPAHAEAHALRAAIRLRHRDLQGALADLNRALQLRPAYPQALRLRASVKWRLGDWAGVVADHTAELELTPGQPRVLVNRGKAKTKLQDLDGAYADYSAAIVSDPDFYPAYADRGMIHMQRGEWAKAIPELVKALELAPATWRARAPVAEVLEDARAKLAAEGR